MQFLFNWICIAWIPEDKINKFIIKLLYHDQSRNKSYEDKDSTGN
jgi:hypothetical protein